MNVTASENGENAIAGDVIVKKIENAAGNNGSGDSNTSAPEDKAESDSPKTGDDTMLLGYVILMLAALGIGGTLAVNRKKN